jgi:hypothetical protein
MASGRAVAAVTALRSWQGQYLSPKRAFYLLDDKLGNPVTSPELHRVLGIGVQQNHLDLATVPCVDGARRIDDRQPVPGGQSGARVHEPCVPIWQRDAHACADSNSLARLQIHVRGEVQITARIARVSAPRERQIWIESPDQHLDRSGLAAGARHLTILRVATTAG